MFKGIIEFWKKKFLTHLLEKDDDLINDVVGGKVDSLAMKERDFIDIKVFGKFLNEKNELGLLKTDGSYIENLQMMNTLGDMRLAQKIKKTKNINEALVFDWGSSNYSDTGACPTEEEVIFYQSVIAKKYRFSSVVRNATNAVKFYTAGKGAVTECPSNSKVDRLVGDVLYDNKFDEVHKDWIADTYLEGELYLCFYFSGDKIWIEDFDPRSIVNIERHPNNDRFEVAYNRNVNGKSIWYESVESYFKEFDKVKPIKPDNKTENDKAILHIKYGNHRSMRGVPPLEPILKWDRIADELDLDLARFVHERSRIPWVLQILAGKVGDYTPERINDRVRGSATKVESKNRKWRAENVKLDQIDWEKWGRPYKLKISSGLMIPDFILFMDSTSNSYSSFRKADSPFIQFILNEQDFWASNIRRICQVIVKYYHNKGKIKDTFQVDPIHLTSVREHLDIVMWQLKQGASINEIKEEVQSNINVAKTKKVMVPFDRLPFSVTFPSPNPENMLLLAQSVQILVSIGIMSRKTAARLVGLDPKFETYNIEKDPNPINTDGLQNPNPRDKSPDQGNRSENDFDSKLGK